MVKPSPKWCQSWIIWFRSMFNYERPIIHDPKDLVSRVAEKLLHWLWITRYKFKQHSVGFCFLQIFTACRVRELYKLVNSRSYTQNELTHLLSCENRTWLECCILGSIVNTTRWTHIIIQEKRESSLSKYLTPFSSEYYLGNDHNLLSDLLITSYY
jgi:hypothetical protein